MAEDKTFFGIKAVSLVDALAVASSVGDIGKMHQIISNGVQINGIAEYCKSPALHRAAGQGWLEAVKLLVENGADLDSVDRNNMTPLMNACTVATHAGEAIAIYLIEAGANVGYVRQSDCMTALKFAATSCSPELIGCLLEHGADVDGPPETDQTALMIAARDGNTRVMEKLIAAGADVHRKCQLPWAMGKSILWLAKEANQIEAIAVLTSHGCAEYPSPLDGLKKIT